MKSITIVSPIYSPETNAGAKRSTAMAEYLAAKGWNVAVVTVLPNHPQNKIYDGYDVNTPHKSLVNGVKVYRLRPWLVPKDNFILRLISETLFSLQAFIYLLRNQSDIIVATCPYIFVGPFSLLASKLKRSVFVWDVRDLIWLYPKAAGKRTFGLDKVFDLLMRFTAKKASVLTTATEGLLAYFKRKPDKAIVLANGVNQKVLESLKPQSDSPFSKHDIKVLYGGLFGYNHGLTTLIEMAKLLPDIPLTLSGDGPERSRLEQMVKDYGLNNVSFTGYLTFEQLKNEYQRADILVSHVRHDPLFEWTQPAKLWEYMATGKPVIHAGEGEVIDIIENYKIAVAVPPENPRALADALLYLADHPEEARAMGQRGRRFVEEHRSREKLLGELERLLEQALTTKNL
jgi:glycosyltransferase involved in cell wall biosynthesis